MPGISRVAFTLGGQSVYWYGILMATAIFLAAALCLVREKRYALPKDTTLNLCLLAVPLAIVGARLYYVAFTWRDYAANPWLIFDLRSGGLAIYGGILGGILAGVIVTRRAKIRFWTLADLAAPALALGQAIGRWGNFFNQEAYGYPVENPALQFFPLAVYIEREGGWHMATFFYESAWCLALCVFLLIWERRRARRFPGEIFCLYVILYGLERAAVEGLRTDSLMLGSLRVSQALSLLAALVGIVVYIQRKKALGRHAV